MSELMCSRAGCRHPALWRIDWRNPRLHDVSRRKTWLACEEHRAYLEDFLGSRDFPLTITTLATTDA